MDSTKYYNHVISWIKSYHNADALNWLHRFVNNSNQPVEIKSKLHTEIDNRVATLTSKPVFINHNGDMILSDGHNHPKVYTTRFSALCKAAELKMKGYDTEAFSTGTFYRIKLIETAPIENYELVKPTN